MGIRLYCGINEAVWNYFPVSPGKYACVSPVMGSSEKGRKETYVFVPDGTEVIQDSGAFCDGPGSRLSFQDALRRQIDHAKKYKYLGMITHRASYDLLIDEKWIDGKRKKQRWEERESWKAVKETIDSAKFLSTHRDGIGVILSAQGVTLSQYMQCAEEIVPLMQENDIFGLGGWCILGRKRGSLQESFETIMNNLIPYLANHKINRVHIWGVMYAYPLGELLYECDKYKIHLSTDSSGPQKRPIMGIWGYADWKDYSYKRPSVEIRGQERAKHVIAVREWLDRFRSTKYYRPISNSLKWRKI